MEPVFTLQWPEFVIAQRLQSLLPRKDGYSVLVPLSRQEEGIDLAVLHRRVKGPTSTATIQVKASRTYLHMPPKREGTVRFRFNTWFNRFDVPDRRSYAKSVVVDDDFVPPEQMAVLQDISSVNFKDLIAVRDRLLAVCLCYDFALRIGEVARLRVSDVAIHEYVELTIRSEIQKGHGKPTKLDYSYFPESKVLMTAYLKLREEKHPATDALIIAEKGEPLLESGCRGGIQQLCQQLGVKTFKGKVPAPHRFRHSFGTCNVTPLGLNLDVYDVMKRLRHNSFELTTRTYISDNPLLTKAKHDEHVARSRAAGGSRILQLSPSSSMGKLPHHATVNITASPALSSSYENQDGFISEIETLRILAPLGFVRMSLQKYAEEKNMLAKRKGQYFYARQLVDDLCNNYFSKREAMRIIGFAKSGFFYWVQSRGIEQVVIGKVSLVRKDDVLAKSRSSDLKRSA